MDWYVILTPLLVLPVVVLLGFTGCHLLFDLEEVEPPPPPPPPTAFIVFQVRIPSFLTVVLCRFTWMRPTSNIDESAPLPDLQRTNENGTFVLSFTVPYMEAGGWRVTCRLRVQDTTRMSEDDKSVNFMVTPVEGVTSTVLFETAGRPDTMDFGLVPIGLLP